MCLVDEANEVIMQKNRIWPPHQDFINYEVAKCIHTENPVFAEAFGGTITPAELYGKQSGVVDRYSDPTLLAIPADLNRLGNRLFLPDRLRFIRPIDKPCGVVEASKTPSCLARGSQGSSAAIPSAVIDQAPQVKSKAYSSDPLKTLSMIANTDARYSSNMVASPVQTQNLLPRRFPLSGSTIKRNDTGPRMQNPPFILPKDVYPPGYFDRPRV